MASESVPRPSVGHCATSTELIASDIEPESVAPPLAANYRWLICGLLFLATMSNYADRQVLGILAPQLETQIGWSESQYGLIVTAFSTAYAIGLLAWGGLIDRLGTRLGYAAAMTLWNLAAMAHAMAATALGFAEARFLLGLGAAGNFPAAIKTVAEWFPRKQRALATGIFNAGSNFGAILAPILVPCVASSFGWKAAFLVTGGLGFVWLGLWLTVYTRRAEPEPPQSGAERAEAAAKVPWLTLLGHRQTWAFVVAKILTDPIWWFYLYWLPKFLKAEHNLQLTEMVWPLVVVYTIANVGSVGGGWLSGRFMNAGWSTNWGRKMAMLACALAVTPIVFAPHNRSLWLAVLLVGLAAAAHQGWSANLFTTASDMFPRNVVASVVGIGGFAGAIGAMAFQAFTGYFLEWTHKNYTPLFWICGLAYLAALAALHLLVPRLTPADLDA